MKDTCDFLLIPLFLAVIISSTVGQPQHCTEVKDFQNPPDGVCSSIHISGIMSQFKKLENCTVIEGYLRISLIEEAVPEDFENWSFPLLREITAYLSLFRVYQLKTLRHLFPNLAVIGGHQLFNNYALVVYEMLDLEELGLVSLRSINRGGVRITRSKKLCYVDTVDWDFLGVDPGSQDFKDNKEESQCANYCPEDCPITEVGNVKAKRCWTSQHCQQGLNCQNCRMNQTCQNDGTCCHEYCLGGCSGPGPEDCFSCKEVSYQGSCHMECPPNTYKYAERRCLTAKECISLVNYTEDTSKNTKILRSDKAELRVCVSQCPQNYTVQEEGEFKNLECIRCQGFCPKVCNGTEVTSIGAAQKLQGCSKIVGSLIIRIRGGNNIAYEMEKNLGNIKEVTGFINIKDSYYLLTLYFLKSLEIIGGESLFNDRSSFIVMDNANLVDLFPEEQMKRIVLKNGRVSFHSNRKLCKSKIKTFVKYLNLTESEQEIGAENGNLLPCIEHELSLNVTDIYHNTVVLNWTKDTSNANARHLLAYIINYKEIKSIYDDINIYEGQDACFADAWMTNEALPADDVKPYQAYALKDLKAYTNYAVYVQAYTLDTAIHSAMTNIETFKTNPYYPTEPLDLEVTSDDPHELYVKWKPPKYPNGIVTHYKVLYQKQELDIKSFEKRDYCSEPISAPSETTQIKEEVEKTHNVTADCCACPKSKEEREAEARKREIEIYFENYLHDQVYCQRYDTLPADIALNDITGWSDLLSIDPSINSRNITNNVSDELLVPYNTSTSTSADNGTQGGAMRNNLTIVIQEVIVNDTAIYLPNLEHFQEYSIEVQACHDTNPNEPIGTKLCSNRALAAGRTKASWTMDLINETTVVAQVIRNVTVDVMITWEPPQKPNGLILNYHILYKRANQENLVPQTICINISDFQKYPGYRLTGLDPGNWTYQISAVSLARNSSYTSEKYFTVPHIPGDDGADEIIIIIIVIVLVLILIALGVWLFIKFRLRKLAVTVISPNENYVPSEPMYTMDGWEVDRDKIKLLKELGQGSFGMVYEGVAKGLGDDPDEEIRVAVKTVNDRASFNDKREFLKEATTMKAFDCFHVVKLLGVVSTGQPALVIMELMALGDLKNYLREHRPDEIERPGVSPPKLLDILQMAGEIADGMAYLADKKFVHRDLAARNCMVAEDKTVKIGDFGMTRDIYETDYYRKGGQGMLPVRWMAPESLKDGVFTSMSDVWSYGVVMWEMVTLAAQPYQGLSNEEVVFYISEDSTMDIPDRCPEEMAYLMQRCWTKKPKNRPTFKEIIEYLLPHLTPRFQKVSYFFSDGGGPRGIHGSEGDDIFEAEGSDHAGSSLSCEAAAAPQLSLSSHNGNYNFHGSPHPSGGSVSLYDDDIDTDRYMFDDAESGHFYHQRRDSHIDESFEDFSDCNIHNEFDLELDDSSQPFISGDFQAIPLKTWHPPLLSHDQGGNNSTLHNSGLELQPLINKDYDPTPSSSRFTSVQSSHPYSSERIGHHPPTVTTFDLRTPSGSQSLLQQHKIAADDTLQSGSPASSSHFGQPNWSSSTKQSPPLVVTRPILRLPTLNQPPSGGFQRMPLYKQGDKNSYSSRNSQRYNQPSSSDRDCHQLASTTANVSSEEETSPSSTAQHNSPPLSTMVNSSDDSKESSKSSGSHSHINGLTNGHIPMMHRNAPC